MTKTKKPPFRNSLWVSGIFALLSLGLALYSFYNLQTFRQNARRAQGKVIELVPQRKVFRPRVKFATEQGEIIRFTATVGASDTTQLKTGSVVPVLYHPKSPQDAIIDDYWQIYQPSWMILIFGVSPLLLVLLVRFILVPRNKS
ncbi:MAG: DUF3592 domain-containing protein [Microscillaceae bacterium]|jgi:hypothetical protein|nr:DUF3592 domain-containing protein [Microscillaceae bacterium]